jgi:ABC-type branched-subunit amino acid transport system substrate-binding protein
MAFQDEGTVRIGLLESQTGVLAPYGIPGLLGSQIAIEEINNAGGITVAGKKVKLAPVGQEDCARFVASQNVAVDELFTERWALKDAVKAYELFDMQSSGKAVFVM